MAKGRMTITASDTLKDDLERIGEWYLKQNVDVYDPRRGVISLSAVIEQLVAEKLKEIEGE